MEHSGTGDGFRAQLVISEQRVIYDHWLALCAGRGMPCRSELSPAQFPRLLPNISLIELDRASGRFRVRLAGTRLREVYDRDITGLHVDEIERLSNADYWINACRTVVETGRPVQGAIRSPRQTKDHLVQFWIRLPLAVDGDHRQILGYDVCVPSAHLADGLGLDLAAGRVAS